MLEKTENKGSFIFRGCERHDTGWPKSFANRGTRKLVYLEQFGRATRVLPEPKIRDFDYQAWILEEQSARLPKDDVLIPDIDDPDHPAWNGGVWNGKEFSFEPVAIPDCNNPMAEPVYDPVTNNPAAFTLEQILAGAGEPWYVPESLPYPKGSYRAENHSLNDGNRDSRWAGLDRRAKIFFRDIWKDFSDFAYAVPSVLILWVACMMGLLSFSIVIMRAFQP